MRPRVPVSSARARRAAAAIALGAALASVSACGVRAPSRIDVLALVRTRGDDEARRTLAIRVLENPRDVQARLAFAELADKLGRPSEAIEQLEAVERLGGPLGVRWHDADRKRLGRLLAVRGKLRTQRGAASALADLERARALGAPVSDAELGAARLARAIARLRHVDAAERAAGKRLLASLWKSPPIPAGLRPTDAAADAPDVAALAIAAGPHATPAQRGELGAWLWLVGARRAAYEELAAWHDASHAPREAYLEGAYLRALAWWSPVWLGQGHAPPPDELAAAGTSACLFPEGHCAPPEEPWFPPPAAPPHPGYPAVVEAAAQYAVTRVPGAPSVWTLRDIGAAYLRDPAIAERRARDVIAAAPDGAVAHATLGALFVALGDPRRARAEWQAAVDASAEPAFYRGLAEATARGGDADAALVFATTGAAASGDPAATWLEVARALHATGREVETLVAARSAIDLAGFDVLPGALDVAILASAALGRDAQVDELRGLRMRLPPPAADVRRETAAVRTNASADANAQLWVALQHAQLEIEGRRVLRGALDPTDERRTTLETELVQLAGVASDAVALDAVNALR